MLVTNQNCKWAKDNLMPEQGTCINEIDKGPSIWNYYPEASNMPSNEMDLFHKLLHKYCKVASKV